MERLRILAAALALRSFTVSQLAAFSGANEQTVRSVLRRDHEFFTIVGSEMRGPGLVGRPVHRYHTRNTAKLREELKALEATLELARPTLPEETDDDRLAALVVAESAALRAVKAAGEEEQAVLVDTSRRCLEQSRALEDATEERRRRGQLLAALLARLSPV